MASEMSARQRKLVEAGAKGVADRSLADPTDAARAGVRFRSAVKRFGGKPPDDPARPVDPQRQARKRSTRAEQAAAGMMGPSPGRFDEKSVADWIGKMSDEDRRKLGRLMEAAQTGKDGRSKAWERAETELGRQGVHLDVRAGNVTINTGARQSSDRPENKPPYQPGNRRSNNSDWGRHLAKLKDFING